MAYGIDRYPISIPDVGLETREDKGVRVHTVGGWAAQDIEGTIKPATPPIPTKGAKAIVINGVNYCANPLTDAELRVGQLLTVGEDEIATPLDIIDDTDLVKMSAGFKTLAALGSYLIIVKLPMPRYIQLYVKGAAAALKLTNFVSGVQLLF
jgi:hypothetical protein